MNDDFYTILSLEINLRLVSSQLDFILQSKSSMIYCWVLFKNKDICYLSIEHIYYLIHFENSDFMFNMARRIVEFIANAAWGGQNHKPQTATTKYIIEPEQGRFKKSRDRQIKNIKLFKNYKRKLFVRNNPNDKQ